MPKVDGCPSCGLIRRMARGARLRDRWRSCDAAVPPFGRPCPLCLRQGRTIFFAAALPRGRPRGQGFGAGASRRSSVTSAPSAAASPDKSRRLGVPPAPLSSRTTCRVSTPMRRWNRRRLDDVRQTSWNTGRGDGKREPTPLQSASEALGVALGSLEQRSDRGETRSSTSRAASAIRSPRSTRATAPSCSAGPTWTSGSRWAPRASSSCGAAPSSRT